MPSLARRIHDRAHLTGEFRLRSGAVSDEYFDKYRFEADPELLREVAEGLVGLLPEGIDALAGLELGGIPLATAASLASGLPARFVRKAAKDYGTANRLEGSPAEPGECVCLVEDVVTSGGAAIDAVEALREAGLRVSNAVCVVDREEGGAANLAAAGLELRTLFTMSELRAAA